MMPSLQCPECRKELLPPNLNASEEHIICSRCGREIHENIKEYPKMECPKCKKVIDTKEFVLSEYCCC